MWCYYIFSMSICLTHTFLHLLAIFLLSISLQVSKPPLLISKIMDLCGFLSLKYDAMILGFFQNRLYIKDFRRVKKPFHSYIKEIRTSSRRGSLYFFSLLNFSTYPSSHHHLSQMSGSDRHLDLQTCYHVMKYLVQLSFFLFLRNFSWYILNWLHHYYYYNHTWCLGFLK